MGPTAQKTKIIYFPNKRKKMLNEVSRYIGKDIKWRIIFGKVYEGEYSEGYKWSVFSVNWSTSCVIFEISHNYLTCINNIKLSVNKKYESFSVKSSIYNCQDLKYCGYFLQLLYIWIIDSDRLIYSRAVESDRKN